MMKINFISSSLFNPFIRFAHRFIASGVTHTAPRKAYDRRLFYVESGDGSILCENADYTLSPGCLVTFPPNTKYSIASGGAQPLSLISVNFDITQQSRLLSEHIEPDVCEKFDYERITDRVCASDCPIANRPIFLKQMQALLEPLTLLLNEFTQDKTYSQFIVSGLMKSILFYVYRQAEKTAGSSRIVPIGPMLDILCYIEKNCEKPLSNETIGALFNYHPNYINRQVLLHTGKSLHQYLISCRIERAMQVLTSTEAPISDIAAKCGFHDARHFAKVFTGKIGMSPSRYRAINVKGKSAHL